MVQEARHLRSTGTAGIHPVGARSVGADGKNLDQAPPLAIGDVVTEEEERSSEFG